MALNVASVPGDDSLLDGIAGTLTHEFESVAVWPALRFNKILLAFDDDYAVEVAMAEAPHGTAPSLMGKDLANPMAMLLACGAPTGRTGCGPHALHVFDAANDGALLRSLHVGGCSGALSFTPGSRTSSHRRGGGGR